MTDRRDDLTETPVMHERDRTEYEWLMARDADPSAPAPSAETAKNYAQMEHLLATLPEDQDDSWQAAVLQRVHEASKAQPAPTAVTPIRRRSIAKWGAITGGLVAVAAALTVVLLPAEELSAKLEVRHNGATVRGDTGADRYHLGEHITTAPMAASSTEIRAYAPDGALVAHCPGRPGCTAEKQGHRLDFTIDQRGTYHVCLVRGGHSQMPDSASAFCRAAQPLEDTRELHVE